MIKVGVIGATGYTGGELVRILSGHPDVKLTILTSRQHIGVPLKDVFPAMSGVIDLECEAYDPDRVCEKADVIFMALPHKLPMQFAPELIRRGKKVVDLSADFRFKDIDRYEAFYQPHTAKELIDCAVYGLCEVYAEKIKGAQLVGNPGCYPTSLLLPLVPLLKSGIVDHNTIIADAKSGVSGAGRSVSLTTHFCEVNESFKAYKIGVHRHAPEMEEILSDAAGKPVSITFVPHLVPMTRGMLTTIYADISGKFSSEDIRECLADYYKGRHFIRLRFQGQPPDTLYVRGTNYCDIGFKIDEKHRRLILISAIDNLVKGASGQAVQNMNIMMGIEETRGLLISPFPV